MKAMLKKVLMLVIITQECSILKKIEWRAPLLRIFETLRKIETEFILTKLSFQILF
jgi:hypothetical protein